MTKNEKIYRDALSNILKLGGVCWDGNRKCHDSQSVARAALQKVDSEYLDSIDSVSYGEFYVKRDDCFYRKTTQKPFEVIPDPFDSIPEEDGK